MTPSNIIFIVLDTLRADRILSNYKNIFLTPFIKNLLNNSIYFKNCVANNTWTLPSHISMFTGLYSTQNMLISNRPHVLSPKVPVLAEILRDMGYYTICYSENAFISKIYGLTRGFDKTFDNWKLNCWSKEKYKLNQLIIFLQKLNFLKIWHHINDRCERLIKKMLLRFITKSIIFKLKNETIIDLEKFSQKIKNNSNKKPIYLFFNFLTTHDPYIPMKKLFKSFNITFKDFKITKDIILNPLKYRLKVDIESKYISKKKINIIKKLYDAGVSSADFVIKKVFSIFKKMNLLENSYIIITSDHGEHLGGNLDHNLWLHCTYLNSYEEVLKVPLLIYNSNLKPMIIENQVQLIDLYHTILHLTGIPKSQNKYLQLNKSIMYQIETNSTPKYIFGEDLKSKGDTIRIINAHRRSINKNLIPKIFNSHYFLRSNNYKYFKYKNCNIEEFYNLLTDPNEQINIFNKDNEICRKMMLKMEKILNIINNTEELKTLITEKEKDLLKKKISSFKIKGI